VLDAPIQASRRRTASILRRAKYVALSTLHFGLVSVLPYPLDRGSELLASQTMARKRTTMRVGEYKRWLSGVLSPINSLFLHYSSLRPSPTIAHHDQLLPSTIQQKRVALPERRLSRLTIRLSVIVANYRGSPRTDVYKRRNAPPGKRPTSPVRQHPRFDAHLGRYLVHHIGLPGLKLYDSYLGRPLASCHSTI
jgi:hypothetical protein